MRIFRFFALGFAATPLLAANPYFVTVPVQSAVGAQGQASAAPSAAGMTLLREHAPGEIAHQLNGPDGPAPGRIFTRPSQGSYAVIDAGSQWPSSVGQGQTVLAIAETYAGQYGWTGSAFAGALGATLSKADIVATRLAMTPLLLQEIPAPQLVQASPTGVLLSITAGTDASGLAQGWVLWRQGSDGVWLKKADIPMVLTDQTYLDSQVQADAVYHYGLSIRYAWTGGAQAGALPDEAGSYVTLARSDSGAIWASLKQPSPTPFPTLAAQVTPDLGAEAWLAYPNPLRDGNLRIVFQMAKKGAYRVRVYNIEGSLTRSAAFKAEAPGWQQALVDLRNQASGVYLVHLQVTPEGEPEYALPMRKLALVR